MKAIAYEDFARDTAGWLRRVEEDCITLHVTRPGKETIILLADSAYSRLEETAGLMRDPVDAAKTRRALATRRVDMISATLVEDAEG